MANSKHPLVVTEEEFATMKMIMSAGELVAKGFSGTAEATHVEIVNELTKEKGVWIHFLLPRTDGNYVGVSVLIPLDPAYGEVETAISMLSALTMHCINRIPSEDDTVVKPVEKPKTWLN